jgi:micrococcal nuclease
MLSAIFLATVIGISNGDTLTVLNKSKQQIKIRLSEIDAPEQHQPFGTRSKQSLSDLCFGKQAEIIPQVIDRYKRTVAKVKCEGVDANAEQVSRGMAWVYNQYVKDQSLFILQNVAKAEKRGLWADPFPTPPWIYRRTKRHA